MHRISSLSKMVPATAFALILGATLVACTAPEVPLQPAVDANDPACAEVIIRLPDVVAEQEQRRTNAQSTGAWGNPSAIELFCGIVPSGPTTDRCVSVNGIDWIVDPSGDPLYRFEAYGRSPGLEVFVDSEIVSGTETLLELSSAVSHLPQERHCLDLYDEIG